jgi:hypothetical protein
MLIAVIQILEAGRADAPNDADGRLGLKYPGTSAYGRR